MPISSVYPKTKIYPSMYINHHIDTTNIIAFRRLIAKIRIGHGDSPKS